MPQNDDNNKKVDGIKKLSPDELKRSRDIILQTISDSDETESNEIPVKKGIIGKKVDALHKGEKKKPEKPNLIKADFLKKYKETDKAKPAKAIEPEISNNKKTKWREEIQKIIPKEKPSIAPILKKSEEETAVPKETVKDISAISKLNDNRKTISQFREKTVKLAQNVKTKPRQNLSMINPFGNDVVKQKIQKAKVEAVKKQKKSQRKEQNF